MSNEVTPTNDIAARAQALWEEAGRPSGRDLEFWLAAETQIRSAQSGSVTTAAARSNRTSQESARTNGALKPSRQGNGRTRSSKR